MTQVVGRADSRSESARVLRRMDRAQMAPRAIGAPYGGRHGNHIPRLTAARRHSIIFALTSNRETKMNRMRLGNHRGGLLVPRAAMRTPATPMRPAFTLVELLIVISVVALLMGILVPSLSAAKRQAVVASCAARLRAAASALKMYGAGNNGVFPPFAFSAPQGNLPLSGHWGGAAHIYTLGSENVNLWRLVSTDYASPGTLVCPGADAGLLSGQASYFPDTSKYSTYCLRMPYSRDLFASDPGLMNYVGGGLLGIYGAAAGGERFYDPHRGWIRPPLVRQDGQYREDLAGQTRVADMSVGAIVSDAFWRQDTRSETPGAPPLVSYPVRAAWCHQEKFNVLFGDGAVWCVTDDGTIRDRTVPPGADDLPDDGQNQATYAIPVWRYFEDRR